MKHSRRAAVQRARVYRCLGVKPQCGRCVPEMRGLVRGHGAAKACLDKVGGDD